MEDPYPTLRAVYSGCESYGISRMTHLPKRARKGRGAPKDTPARSVTMLLCEPLGHLAAGGLSHIEWAERRAGSGVGPLAACHPGRAITVGGVYFPILPWLVRNGSGATSPLSTLNGWIESA
jgi:hypothetical protein